jgi:aryl-alcohol dehydrogenase-like predicted oxidoreductase
LKDEHPRDSYSIITKTGKYGPKAKDHIYDPEVTKKAVERSLKRFNTDYLDVVCTCAVGITIHYDLTP